MLEDLCPGDIIVYRFAGGYGILNSLANKLLDGWGHVGLFYDSTKRGLPLTIESIGRGVMIRSLLESEGREVAILRWTEDAGVIGRAVAKCAERLADNPDSWYGYFDIPRFVVPRLIWFWLTKRQYGFGYERNPHFICSELVDQSYRDAGFPLFSSGLIPLPADFVDNPLLEEIYRGKLEL